jgi:predicted small secreted protein
MILEGKYMINRAFIISILAATLFLAGCGNTLRGAGRDISTMGQNIESSF